MFYLCTQLGYIDHNFNPVDEAVVAGRPVLKCPKCRYGQDHRVVPLRAGSGAREETGLDRARRAMRYPWGRR